jgi:hypothetical protein
LNLTGRSKREFQQILISDTFRKMKTLIAAFTLIAMAANAEVVIYNQTIKDAGFGAGDLKNRTWAGWLVFDTDSHEVREVLARKLNKPSTPKTFIERGSDANVQILSGPQNKFALWAEVPVYDDDGGASFRGVLVSMTVGTTNHVVAPKTMTVKGVNFESDSQTLHEFSGVANLDKKLSTAANLAGWDLNTAVSNLEASLLAKGYVQF